MPAAVLLDVGGTLWPQTGPPTTQIRLERLARAFPNLPAECTMALLTQLNADSAHIHDGGPQDVAARLRDVSQAVGLPLKPDEIELLRQALCVPAIQCIQLFPGVDRLLHTIQRLGRGCAIVSNADVRSGADYQRDFRDFGFGGLIQAFVSSIDVGMRKPDPLPFLTALERLNCRPEQAIMVGDSERNDIEPAHQLGARTIRVAIEVPPPAHTVADALATNLDQVAETLTGWVK